MTLLRRDTADHTRGGTHSPYHVMVVDDSAVIRGLISRWLGEDPEIRVVASCANGAQAVREIERRPVEVVVLDIEMPEMDGLTALPHLIKHDPALQVVMASTLTRRNADISLRALSMGAADYVAKPESVRGVTTSDEFKRDLTIKVKALGEARRRGGAPVPSGERLDAPKAGTLQRTASLTTPRPRAGGPIVLRKASTVRPRALVVGSSTGGPQALFELLGGLKRDLEVPVFLVQHMPATFTAILAEHLAKVTNLPCAEGQDGETARAGHIYVAPGERHMRLKEEGGRVIVRLSDEAPVNYCRPSVDPLFHDAAKIYGAAALGVVLTGMGHDGCEGARLIADAGGTILAQDEATSVVWGMPGAVAAAGVCAGLYPITDMASAVRGFLRGGR